MKLKYFKRTENKLIQWMMLIDDTFAFIEKDDKNRSRFMFFISSQQLASLMFCMNEKYTIILFDLRKNTFNSKLVIHLF